jgi:tetratricopeptide (TPR) repeat protein
MAAISLRQYNRDIETMINRGQTDEAITHCKHILQNFPKHLDTYRLLGKAYLESQRYSEAADVFQRVVASVPDDFVSHVGLSMIREDEGNLDAAIWHMERAFEIQSSNTAVQEEIKRLYGRRDGNEPARIRLTRGALGRMYARGDLYHQAITEITAALASDPLRYDLQVLLARVHFYSDQIVEATEICTSLLARYPFCYEANQILAEILPDTSRSDDAEIYRQRVIDLDPYIAYISSSTPSLNDVPDSSVMLERLELKKTPFIEDSKSAWDNPADPGDDRRSPAFVNPFSFDLPYESDLSENEVSDQEISSSSNIASDWFLSDEEIISPGGPEEVIPSWMKDAGWTAGSETPEEKASVIGDEEDDEDQVLSAAEIPDWLKPYQPQDTTPEEAENPLQPIVDSWTGQKMSTQNEDLLDDLSPEIPDWLNPILETPIEASTWPSSESIGISLEEKSEQKEPTLAFEQTEGLNFQSNLPPVNAIEISYGQEDTQAWLENLAALHGSEAETLIARPEDRFKRPVIVEDSTKEVDLKESDVSEISDIPDGEASPSQSNDLSFLPEEVFEKNPEEKPLLEPSLHQEDEKQPGIFTRWFRKLTKRETTKQTPGDDVPAIGTTSEVPDHQEMANEPEPEEVTDIPKQELGTDRPADETSEWFMEPVEKDLEEFGRNTNFFQQQAEDTSEFPESLITMPSDINLHPESDMDITPVIEQDIAFSSLEDNPAPLGVDEDFPGSYQTEISEDLPEWIIDEAASKTSSLLIDDIQLEETTVAPYPQGEVKEASPEALISSMDEDLDVGEDTKEFKILPDESIQDILVPEVIDDDYQSVVENLSEDISSTQIPAPPQEELPSWLQALTTETDTEVDVPTDTLSMAHADPNSTELDFSEEHLDLTPQSDEEHTILDDEPLPAYMKPPSSEFLDDEVSNTFDLLKTDETEIPTAEIEPEIQDAVIVNEMESTIELSTDVSSEFIQPVSDEQPVTLPVVPDETHNLLKQSQIALECGELESAFTIARMIRSFYAK